VFFIPSMRREEQRSFLTALQIMKSGSRTSVSLSSAVRINSCSGQPAAPQSQGCTGVLDRTALYYLLGSQTCTTQYSSHR
jgi:hypothetical protein